jgi:hypothetical protein
MADKKLNFVKKYGSIRKDAIFYIVTYEDGTSFALSKSIIDELKELTDDLK